MDLLTIAIIVVAGLLAIGITAYMLNRAWGNFPSRVGQLPPDLPPAPQRRLGATPPVDEEEAEAEEDSPTGWETREDMIPITNPVVARAVNAALDRGGGPYAMFFTREGDQVYFAAYRVPDPARREQLIGLFKGLNAGDLEGVSLVEVMQVMSQLRRK
ncbi:MAG: hypothetical protein RMK84_12445 [Oscillochloridaceae bacterium]|nr:hypothetical protein [Chloroflexaceae bacterium]MDW8390928.1 hypothetical protein [Oscillochloridaceae bacterium]